MNQRARYRILGGVPAVLLLLALALLAFAPAASAAPETCATDGISPITNGEGGLGQEFTVGPAGGDLHAYALAAFGPGLATVSVLPIGASGDPDLTSPLASTRIDLPASASLTTVAFPRPLRLGAGTYVVFLVPDTAASWLFCVPGSGGGLWLYQALTPRWFHSQTEMLALGTDLRAQDLTPPALTVTPPVSPTRTPSVEFSSDDPAATYACSVDGAAAVACASPFQPAGLADGAHQVAITARDVMDNVSAPGIASFTVDTSPPTATITIVSPGNAADHSVAVTIALSEPGSFTCHLDGADLPCAASFAFLPGGEGPHTITVTSADALGNTGEDTAGFLADWTAPAVDQLDDIEATADGSDADERGRPGAVVEFAIVATDNFDPQPAVKCSPASGDLFPLGTTVVTCVATDANGNPSAAMSFRVTVVEPPPGAADIDLAYDPDAERLVVTETHDGDIRWYGRRTLVATAGDHQTRVNVRRINQVDRVMDDLDDGMMVKYLRYDGGPRLKPTSNGYAFRATERRNGSLKRLTIVVRAGRSAVIVKYSAADDESVIRYRDVRSDRTLRVVRVDGLAIPHLRSDAGRMLIDVPGGG